MKSMHTYLDFLSTSADNEKRINKIKLVKNVIRKFLNPAYQV